MSPVLALSGGAAAVGAVLLVCWIAISYWSAKGALAVYLSSRRFEKRVTRPERVNDVRYRSPYVDYESRAKREGRSVSEIREEAYRESLADQTESVLGPAVFLITFFLPIAIGAWFEANGGS